MYENNNTVSIDWKGLFIKLIIVALIIFAIFKGYEYFSNNKPGNSKITTSTATQLFNANLESLRQAGENYYDYSNYPKTGQTVMVTLGELVTKGNIKELYDENGNECNRENSYVAVTNDGGKYKLKATLSCGETSNYTVVMIGCECEGDECAQAIQKLENEKEDKTEDKTLSSDKSGSNSKKDDTEKKDNVKPANNQKEDKKTTTTKPRPVVDMSDVNNNSDKKTTTTTKPKTQKQKTTYRVEFDSNGGDKVETQYVERNETAYEPDEPEKDDARFVGWYYKGEIWDFDNEITKNITLEAYYWETKDDVETTVYSAAYDTLGTTYVTVEHKLAIPAEISGPEFKNQRIKSISSRNTRSMRPGSNDLYYHRLYHTSTYEGYNYYANGINSTTDGLTLGTLYNISVKKSNSYKYDTWVRWSAYVNNQCSYTFDGYNCNYGIVYKVIWEYDELTD